MERLEKAIEYTLYMMRPDGSLPMIGDVDDGRSIRIGKPAFHWDFRAFLAIGAVLFKRGDMKERSGGFHEDALWLMGLDGWKQFQKLDSHPPKDSSVALQDSGYYIMRSGWESDAHTLCFDCGEQADGLFTDATPSAAHGHADCLSIDVCVGGHPFLIDPGFHTYNGSPVWRDYFRKTRAHNTVEVDGADQSCHLGGMDWYNIYQHHLENWIATPIFDYVSGSHNGYARLGQQKTGKRENGKTRERDEETKGQREEKKGGSASSPLAQDSQRAQGTATTTHQSSLIHRRSVFFRRPDYWIIRDELSGGGEHEIACYWHLAPEVRARMQADGCRLHHTNGQGLLLRSLGIQFEAEIVTSEEGNPASGWIAPGYGQKIPSSSLHFRKRLRLPAVWYTLLYPYSEQPPNLQVDWLSGDLRIQTDRFEDFLCCKGLINLHNRQQTEGISTDAEWFCLRRSRRGVHSVCLVNGRFFEVSGHIAFEAEKKLSHAVITNEGKQPEITVMPEIGYRIWQKGGNEA